MGFRSVVYKKPCGPCPSAHYPEDPEARDYRIWFMRGEVKPEDILFVCAWRRKKFCRGLVDQLGIGEGCARAAWIKQQRDQSGWAHPVLNKSKP